MNQDLRFHFPLYVAALAGTLLVAACGGGGGSNDGPAATIQSGVFLDSTVQGLEYSSGATTGVTDAAGTFKYEVGKTVTFKLGSVTMGTLTAGKAKVYPTDLVSGAIDETDPTVSNIVRVLQTLDDDGDPTNGIKITDAVRAKLTTAINFAQAKAAFTADGTVAAAMAAATALRTAGVTGLRSAAAAEGHFKSTLLADFVGTWSGTYTGASDNGTCSATVVAAGTVSGTCHSNPANQNFGVAGVVASSGSALVSGITGTGATFTGSFDRSGKASGTWTDGLGSSGTWAITKLN